MDMAFTEMSKQVSIEVEEMKVSILWSLPCYELYMVVQRTLIARSTS